MIEKIKLSEVPEYKNPDPTNKIPIIKPDGRIEYITICNILRENMRILKNYTIEPGKSINIYVSVGIIMINSPLGTVVFMGSNSKDGIFLVANDNYCSVYGAKTPGKVNVYPESGNDIIYIENHTDAIIRISVVGIGLRDLEEFL